MTKVGEVRERGAVLQATLEATEQKMRKALGLLRSSEGRATVDQLEGATVLVADAAVLLLSVHADGVAMLRDGGQGPRDEIEEQGGSDGNAVG